ncbi:hypothetical protein XELAEV_18029330mg [Xenopus laevis]|uniref:Uncharacterized protein n=1 Tax=Xenopus laevis TaxID=8355 RepID=A0A974CRW3_XENLA|nr:hypothetical protein XELAEV_18029330mg [Xenopus laevis]
MKKPGLGVFIGNIIFRVRFVYPLSISHVSFQIEIFGSETPLPPFLLNGAKVLPFLLMLYLIRVGEATVVHPQEWQYLRSIEKEYFNSAESSQSANSHRGQTLSHRPPTGHRA